MRYADPAWVGQVPTVPDPAKRVHEADRGRQMF